MARISVPAVSGTTRVDTARRILAATERMVDALALHPAPPTVTLSALSAATSIASGVRIAPKRASTTLVDTLTDPHFEYVGQRPGQLAVSSTDCTYPNLLTGGSAQGRRDAVRFRFELNGSICEPQFRVRGTTLIYRVWVDGLPVTAGYTTASGLTNTGRYMLTIDFTTVGTRVIEIDVVDPEFCGVWIAPAATVRRTRRTRPTLAALGDSITSGANGVYAGDSWPTWASRLLGCDWINLGIGGTGFYNGLGSSGDFRSRVAPDAVTQTPDMLVIFGSYNDAATKTQAEIAAEAEYVFTQAKAALPDTVIIAVGCWLVGHTNAPTLVAADNGVKAGAAAAGVPFISLLDPAGTYASTAAWAATTAYLPGDERTQNGYVQKCIVGHTSTGTFDQTKWRSTAFVSGTGKSTALATNGNADTIIGSDGTHPTAEGAKALGWFLAQEITRQLHALVA